MVFDGTATRWQADFVRRIPQTANYANAAETRSADSLARVFSEFTANATRIRLSALLLETTLVVLPPSSLRDCEIAMSTADCHRKR